MVHNTDSFVISVKTKEDIIKDFKKVEDLFDFRNLIENHELFITKHKALNGNFEIETPEIILIDEFTFPRSKMYAFKCGDNSKNKVKGFSKSQSRSNKFEE